MAPRKSRSLDECEKLAKEIGKIRKNIRKKHQTLTQNIIDEEELAEKSLRPVVAPLQKLVQEKNTVTPPSKEKERDADVEMDDIQERLKNKRFSDESENNTLSNKRPAPPNTPLPLPREEEKTYETLPTAEELISTPEGRKSIDHYIDIWFKGLLARQYMRKFFDDDNHDIDHVFGPYFTNGTTLMLGKYPMKIEENDDIIINGFTYKGTPGLYDLIFKKHPDAYLYSEEDLNAYSHMISKTGAYLNLTTNRVKSSASYKYKNIIKPIISTSKPENRGRGLLKLNNNKPNYVYWDDINELCKRLQLLIASQSAGHSGHSNEILSIIEELHEAGIIKEDGASFEAIFSK